MICDLTNKKILITGATGLIGSNLTLQLLNLCNEVIVCSRNMKKIEMVFGEYLNSDKLKYVICDVSKDFPSHITDVDYIFHMASPISSKIIKTNPLDVIKSNILGIKNSVEFLMNQQSQNGKKGRLIVLSSATIYGDCFNEKISVKESNIFSSFLDENIYTETKRFCEILAKTYFYEYQVDIVISRIAWCYGYTYLKPDTAFYEFIDNALSERVSIFNSTSVMIRDNIYIDDVVNGLLCIAQYGVPGEVYNLSSNGDLNNYKSITEIGSLIIQNANELFGIKSKFITKEKYIDYRYGPCLDNNKLKKIGWNLEYDINIGIKNTLIKYFKYR